MTQMEASGGSRDTEVKELTNIPIGALPMLAPTATTPLEKRPNTCRNWVPSETAHSTVVGGVAMLLMVRSFWSWVVGGTR